MGSSERPGGSVGERWASAWDMVRGSFGFVPAVAMLLGVGLGFGISALDESLGVSLPVFAFGSHDSARSLLSTIASATVSVAGLAFSVTVVAFTLASSQLSPRVLRNFRRDRLSQACLGLLLGTFVYSIVVLVRLGATGPGESLPNLSFTVAIVLALVAFLVFAIFISHIVGMLQPSAVIAAIQADGVAAIEARYPGGIGEGSESASVAATLQARMRMDVPHLVAAEEGGYLTLVRGDRLVRLAQQHDLLIRQVPSVGSFVVEGDLLAEVWAGEATRRDEGEDPYARVLDGFECAEERTLVQDVAFPVRQLADIALKGLSPGINDPTTAENAIDAITALLVRFVRSGSVPSIRVDEDGRPRFVAKAPDLDDLVRRGFDQVRSFAGSYPVVRAHLAGALERIESAADEHGTDLTELARQRGLLYGPAADLSTKW